MFAQRGSELKATFECKLANKNTYINKIKQRRIPVFKIQNSDDILLT